MAQRQMQQCMIRLWHGDSTPPVFLWNPDARITSYSTVCVIWSPCVLTMLFINIIHHSLDIESGIFPSWHYSLICAASYIHAEVSRNLEKCQDFEQSKLDRGGIKRHSLSVTPCYFVLNFLFYKGPIDYSCTEVTHEHGFSPCNTWNNFYGISIPIQPQS